MTGIKLLVKGTDPIQGSQPVLVEILNSELESVDYREMPSQEIGMIPTPAGRYLVKVLLPDGRHLQEMVNVPEDGTADLEFKPPERELPDPEADVSVGDMEATEQYTFADLDAEVVMPAKGPELPELPFLEFWEGTWARLWKNVDGTWHSAPLDLDNFECAEWRMRYRVDSWGALHFVQVGGPAVAWRFMALPDEASEVEFLVQWQAELPRLEIQTTTVRGDVKALLGYLTSGDLKAADLLASSLMAEELLRRKIDAPRVAALGAYHLLKVGDLKRLHEWPRNLANWMEWLPDGPIIQAWQRIRGSGSDAALEEARQLLLQAVERGIPVYTEGLRLLWDGLRLFHAEIPDDAEILGAIQRIRPYAMAALWEASTTTFFGAWPEEPTRRQILGIPESDGVSFLE